VLLHTWQLQHSQSHSGLPGENFVCLTKPCCLKFQRFFCLYERVHPLPSAFYLSSQQASSAWSFLSLRDSQCVLCMAVLVSAWWAIRSLQGTFVSAKWLNSLLHDRFFILSDNWHLPLPSVFLWHFQVAVFALPFLILLTSYKERPSNLCLTLQYKQPNSELDYTYSRPWSNPGQLITEYLCHDFLHASAFSGSTTIIHP